MVFNEFDECFKDRMKKRVTLCVACSRIVEISENKAKRIVEFCFIYKQIFYFVKCTNV